MDPIVIAVFCVVYAGMILGEMPGLALDRTGIALLGALALVATGRITPQGAWESMDVPTLALLFGLMVVSAQFRLGGFYAEVTRRISSIPSPPDRLLALVMAAAGGLSALLANDIICLAMAPILVEGCARRKLNPIPFLLGLACAANIGSALTLIGNPQNMLIGQKLRLGFGGYLLDSAVPSILGLAVAWWIIRTQFQSRWESANVTFQKADSPAFDKWQSIKGLSILTLLTAGFLLAPAPREVLALGAAGLLLMSRRTSSRSLINLVDWHLLVLFMGLFVVNHAFEQSGTLNNLMQHLIKAGINPSNPAWLFGLTSILSNLVSNVPAVMLLLPVAHHPLAGPILALASTLAGNLFIVGSIANIIVVEQAGIMGVRLNWREHARSGIPVTAATLAIAAGWLWIRAQ